MSLARRGAFIVIEGLDRSGKSTQVKSLVSRINQAGGKAIDIRFPDRSSPTGQVINSYLGKGAEVDDRSIHLLFSANRWEQANPIIKQLEAGITIVCDRYAFSGIAFSAVKGLSYDWCKAPDAGLPRPDLVLFFDISPEAAALRGGFGNERYETSAIQTAVREVFSIIARDVEKDGGTWVTIDASGSADHVGEVVWNAFTEVSNPPAEIEKLWASTPEFYR